MNIVGCDDLGALFLTIVTCVTVGATSVRPQRDRSLRKERPRIRLTIAWEANGLPYGIDVAYEFTYGAPRSYPRAFSCGFAAIHLVAPYDKTGNEIFFPA